MQRFPCSLAPLFALAILLAASGSLEAADAAPAVFEVISGRLESRSAGDDAESAVEAVLQVDLGLIQSDPDAVSVPLPGGSVAVARRTWWSWISADEYHWFGELDDDARGEAAPGSVSFHYYDGRLIGTLRTAGGADYRLEPEDGLHRLVRTETAHGSCGVDHLDHPGEEPGEGPEAIGVGVRSIAAAGSDTECFTPPSTFGIDVMVLYPLTLVGSAQAVQDYAVSKVAEANSLFSLSGVKIVYNLTHVGPITGVQPPGPASSGLAPATGPVLAWLNDQFATATLDTEVELLRKAHGADILSIVVPPHPQVNCGIANLVVKSSTGAEVLSSNLTVPFGARAFSAVELNCGNSDYTFAHELGHNFGMRHDNDRNAAREIRPWAYGYIVPLSTGSRATVMGCVDPNTPICRRINRFSNPDRFYSGVRTGLHSSQSTTPAHNACVANERAGGYAGFASPPPTSPPTLTITSPAEGGQVQPGVAFNLWASATDPEDGNLSSQVRWTSDKDGFLGVGSPRSTILTTPGRHLITAEVTDSSGTKVPYSIRLDAVETDPPRLYVDRPSHNELVSGSSVLVQGWATDATGVTSVTFKVDGVPVTLANFVYGTHRADVCSVHGDLNDPNCPYVGFTGRLNTTQLTNGAHTLTVTVKDFFNNTATFNRRFQSSNVSTAFFVPIADAWVSQAQPASNFGSDTTLRLRASGSGLAKHTYLKFKASGITRPVTAAKLSLSTQSTPLGGLQVYWIQDTTWGEFSINWNNGPLAHYLNFAAGPQPANSRIEIDVSSIVSGNGTYTIGMVSPDVAGQAVYSREALFFSPELKVTY